MSPLEDIGREVADELSALPGERADLARGRQVVMVRPTRPARAHARLFAMAATLTIAAAVALYLVRGAQSLGFEVATPAGARVGVVGAWIEPGEAETALRFSDGSSVLLAARARAEVEQLAVHGAVVRLADGRAAVSVAHAPNTAWRFHVGPFDVRVTGTRFDVEWNAAEETFWLQMHDGSVLVHGPTLEVDRAVVAGQTLRISLRGEKRAPTPASSASAPEASAAPAPTASAAASSASAAQGTAQPTGAAREPTWTELAARGEYARAMAIIDGLGTETVMASASASELLLLGDVARFSGRSPLARRAYTVARSRAAGSATAALAAFSLGRMGGGDSLGWFQRYLAEAPNGPLAREALGRVMELQHRGGQDDVARSTARRYLASYPDGPHAPLARALVASAGDAGTAAAP